MPQPQGPVQRLWQAGKNVLTTLLATGETRLRLIVLELEEERARLITLLMLVGISLILLMLGITALTALVVVVFWETYRLQALAICTAVLLGGGLCLAWYCLHLAKRRTLFVSTLKQLALDREIAEGETQESDNGH